MDITPHFGEIALVVAVILIIFGLGRLPEISLRLAKAFGPPDDGTTSPSPTRSPDGKPTPEREAQPADTDADHR